MSTTTSAVLRISRRSRFMRNIRAIDTQNSRTRPAILGDLVNNPVQAVGLRAAMLDHRIRDRLTKAALLLHRTSGPHVYLHDWHDSLLKLRVTPNDAYLLVKRGGGRDRCRRKFSPLSNLQRSPSRLAE